MHFFQIKKLWMAHKVHNRTDQTMYSKFKSSHMHRGNYTWNALLLLVGFCRMAYKVRVLLLPLLQAKNNFLLQISLKTIEFIYRNN